MTALNFPPQPQDVGNTYVGGNGVTYVWSGTIWTVAGNPGSTGNVVFAGNTIATASGGNVTIQAGTEDWTFTENGTLLVPSPVSSILLFTLDSSHYVPTEGKPVLNLTGSPWQLQGQFVYSLEGVVSLELNNPFPEYVNPGYDSNDAFAFGSDITGIPNYVLTLTLLDVVLEGGAGWTANVAASEPPAYPPSLQSRGATQITSGEVSYVLGADGHLLLPANVSGIPTEISLNSGPAVGYTTANNVPTVADSGGGAGMTVDIVADGFSISSVAINQPGQGYAPGDQLQINQPGSTGNGEITVTATRSHSSMLAWPGLGNLSFDDSGSLALNVNGSVWSFNTDGSTTLPDGEPVYFGNGNATIQAGMGFHINSEEGIAITAINTDTSTNYTWGFSTDGTLYVPPGSYLKADVSSSVGLATNDGNTIAYADPSGFFIDTLYNTEEYQWWFDNTGNLTLPIGGTINWYDGSNALTGGGGSADLGLFVFSSSTITTQSPYSDIYITPDDDGHTQIYIPTSENSATSPISINNYAGNIALYTGGSYAWTFDVNGNLTLPAGGTINFANGSNALTGGGANTGTIGFVGNAIYDFAGIIVENADLLHGATAALTLPANGSSNALTLNRLYGNVTIGTGPAGSITNTWQFDETGNLLIPDSGYILAPNNIYISTLDGVASIDIESDQVHIIQSGNDWGFYSNGTMGFPSNATIQSNNSFNLLVNGNSYSTWSFGQAGVLTLPDGGYIDNNGGITRLGAASNVGVQLGSSDQQNYVTASNVGVTVQTLADTTNSLWTFSTDGSSQFPGPIYGGSTSIGLVSPAPLNLNNTGPVGQVKTQLTLINTAGNAGTGSAIDFFTYVDQGNGLPGARLQSVDNNNYSSNFSLLLKANGDGGNGNLTTVWTFGSNGTTAFPNYTFTAADGTAGQMLTTNGSGSVTWTTPPGPTGNANTGDLTFVNSTIGSSTNADMVWHSNGFDLTFAASTNDGALTLPDYQGTGGYGIITGSTDTTGIDIYTNEPGYSEVWIKPASQGGNVWISTAAEIYVWDFGGTGVLTIPGGSTIGDYTSGYGSGHGLWLNTAYNGNVSSLIQDSISNQIITQDYNNGHWAVINTQFTGGDSSHPEILMITNPGNGLPKNDWILGSDGTTYLPSNAVITSHQYDTGDVTTIGSNISIRTASDGPTYHDWVFEPSGNLTLPTGGTINFADGSNALVGGGAADLGNFSFSSDSMLMPLHARLNSGGVGNTNSAEFGTVVNTYGDNGVVQNSQIYMSAGTGEARILVNMEGHTLVYYGTEEVENPNFTGMVAMDPNVRSQYAIASENGNILLGGAQPGGTLISSDYIAGIGSLNNNYNMNGLYVDSTSVLISTGSEGAVNNSQQFGTNGISTTTTFGNISTNTSQAASYWLALAQDSTTGLYPAQAKIDVCLANIDTPEVYIDLRRASDGFNVLWTFDNTGNLTLPQGGTINFPDGSNALVGGGSVAFNPTTLVQSVNITAAGTQSGGGEYAVTYTTSSLATVIATGIVVQCLGSTAYVEGTTATGSQVVTGTYGDAFANQPYTAYAYVTTNVGTIWSAQASGTTGLCLIAGTLITMANGTTKRIEDISYDDHIRVWDFDTAGFATARALWIKRVETAVAYNELTFSDGSILRTVDQHRIFNKQAGAFTYPMTDDTPLGTITYTVDGTEAVLVSKRTVTETVDYYNVITDRHMNLFANGILTSCRFSNAYPIADMRWVKASRQLRDRAEFAGIADRWIDGLRLCEQTYSVEDCRWYVRRLESLEITELALAA